MARKGRGDSDAHAETVAPATPALDATTPALDARTPAFAATMSPTIGATAADTPLPTGDPARYARGDEVARGGMGRIVRADDLALGRAVAIKELTLDGGEARRRFVREALITARLQHPAIVPVYDAGRWPGGDPFYAMKLVAGRSLADVIAGARSADERLALLPAVTTAAEAVAYAHAHRVIHRDHTPGNILVGDYGETVVIDWGLAKDLTSDEDSPAAPGPATTSDATRVGTVMGTPSYMPPEQALGEPLDERADVYALGAILYHVLSGRPPYTGASSDAVLSAVVAGSLPTPLEELARGIAPDLAAIVRRAMAHDRDARFASAGELAAELERFQKGQLIASHHYTVGQRVRRFVRRHRATLSVAAVLVVALVVTIAVSFRRVTRERDRNRDLRVLADNRRADAERFRAEAEQRASALTLQQARSSLATDATAAIAWLTRLPADRPGWGAAHVIASAARVAGYARDRWSMPGAIERLLLVDDHHLLLEGSDQIWLRDLTSGEQIELGRRGPDPDGGRAPIAVVPGKGLIVAHGSRASYLEFVGPMQFRVKELPDIAVPIIDIVSMSGHHVWLLDETGTRHVIELATSGMVRSRVSFGAVLTRHAFATEGPAAALAGEGGVYFLNPDLRRVSAAGARFDRIAASADGMLVAAAKTAPGRAIHVWDALTGKERLVYPVTGTITDLAFSPDGKRLAVATTSELVELGVPDGDPLQWRQSPTTRLTYTRSGRLVALTTDAVVVVASGETLVLGHPGVLDLVALPDGSVVSTGRRADLRVWDIEAQLMPGRDDGNAPEPDLSRDGRWLQGTPSGQAVEVNAENLRGALAELGHDEPRMRTSTVDGREIIRLDSMHAGAGWLAWDVTPDGANVVMTTERGVEAGPRAGTRRILQPPDDDVGGPRDPIISADGSRVAYVWQGKTVVFDVATGAQRTLADGPRGRFALTPDGQLLAGLVRDQGAASLRVARTSDGTTVIDDRVEARSIDEPLVFDIEIALSPDGARAATAVSDGRLRIWSLTPAHLDRALELGAPATAVLFAPDATWLAVAGGDGKIRVVTLAGDAAPRVLRGPASRLTALAVSPDGRYLAAGDRRGGVWLWDVESGESAELWRHASEVIRVAFTPGGLLSQSEGFGVRLMSRPLPSEPTALRTWLAAATTVRIDADDQAWTP